MLKKVAIIGPESTGKSVLTEQLANHYHCPWNPEYAREYLLTIKRKYTYDDLLIIAKKQWELTEQKAEAARQNGCKVMFTDTEMYIMKVWCEVVFGKCHSWIIDKIKEQQFDLYMLCKPDIPWVKDELREYPDLEMRVTLFNTYKHILQHQETPWVEIGGGYDERLSTAVKAVDALLK